MNAAPDLILAWALALIQMLLFIAAAPLLAGWVKRGPKLRVAG